MTEQVLELLFRLFVCILGSRFRFVLLRLLLHYIALVGWFIGGFVHLLLFRAARQFVHLLLIRSFVTCVL